MTTMTTTRGCSTHAERRRAAIRQLAGVLLAAALMSVAGCGFARDVEQARAPTSAPGREPIELPGTLTTSPSVPQVDTPATAAPTTPIDMPATSQDDSVDAAGSGDATPLTQPPPMYEPVAWRKPAGIVVPDDCREAITTLEINACVADMLEQADVAIDTVFRARFDEAESDEERRALLIANRQWAEARQQRCEERSRYAYQSGRAGTNRFYAVFVPCMTEGRNDAIEAHDAPTVLAGATLTVEGLGPIRVGDTLIDIAAALGQPVQQPNEVELAVANGTCFHVRVPGSPGLLLQLFGAELGSTSETVAGARVGVVIFRDESFATMSGVRVGDAEQKVRDVYVGRVADVPHKYDAGHDLDVVVDEAADHVRVVRFVIADGAVSEIRAGDGNVRLVEGCA